MATKTNQRMIPVHVQLPERIIALVDADIDRSGYGSRKSRVCEIIDRYYSQVESVRAGRSQLNISVVDDDAESRRQR